MFGLVPGSSAWGSLVGSLALLLALTLSIRFWLKRPHPVTLAYAAAAAGWLVYLLGSEAGRVFDNQSLVFFLSRAGWQIAVVTLSFLFLISSGIKRFEIHAFWMIQGLVGLLLLAWKCWSPGVDPAAFSVWLALNLLCSGMVGLHGLRAGFASHGLSRLNWLALTGSVIGLAICAADLLAFEQGQLGDRVASRWFAVAWLLLWFLMGLRRLFFVGQKSRVDEAQSTNWAAVTGFGVFTDVEEAIANERRRMAQELHDGVCSQLVNVMVMLDASHPRQPLIVLALEQCLLDLRIMVDVVGGSEDSLVDALGRLRYRVQRALDALGIRIQWVVDVDGPLQHLHGDRAMQVLRIAQECLANVMRHSGASMVKLVCAYLPDEQLMLLEVRDNGDGMPSRDVGSLGGKGLENMRQRARSLGGELQIHTKAKEGTRVRLLMPLAASAAERKNHSLSPLDSSMP